MIAYFPGELFCEFVGAGIAGADGAAGMVDAGAGLVACPCGAGGKFGSILWPFIGSAGWLSAFSNPCCSAPIISVNLDIGKIIKSLENAE